jgi:hypothetical protein
MKSERGRPAPFANDSAHEPTTEMGGPTPGNNVLGAECFDQSGSSPPWAVST